MTPDTVQHLISHLFSQPGGGGHHTPPTATRGVHLEQSEQEGLQEEGLEVRRVRCCLLPMGGCDWLVCIISQLARN